MNTTGWECPKCHQVWGPQATACLPCNDLIHQQRHREEKRPVRLDAERDTDNFVKTDLDRELAELTLLDAVTFLLRPWRTLAIADRSEVTEVDYRFLHRHSDSMHALEDAFTSLQKYFLNSAPEVYDNANYGTMHDTHPAFIILLQRNGDEELRMCVCCQQIWWEEDTPPPCPRRDWVLSDLGGVKAEDLVPGSIVIDSANTAHVVHKVQTPEDTEDAGIVMQDGSVMYAKYLHWYEPPAKVKQSKIVPRRLPPLRKAAKKTARKKS